MSATISRNELKSKIDRGDEFELVEALSEDSFRERHLPGAVNVPPDQAKQRAPQVLADKNADIVVYCANLQCTASHEVAKELENLGYRNVRRYAEGKEDWVAAGLPTESGQPAESGKSQ